MKFSNTKALNSRLIVALVMAAAGIAGLCGIAEAATCYTCHAPVGTSTDIRPVESTYRNITTGSIVGSHAKHMSAVIPAANASSCNPCHGSTVTLTKHRNGQVEVPAVGYTKGATFAQGTAGLGTCTTASCHDNGLGQGALSLIETPAWGSAGTACAICHPSSPGSGSHPEHFQDAAITCADCHNGYSVQTQTVNATQHIDTNIDVYKTASGDLGYTANKAKATAYTTCSTASCHKNPSTTVAGPAFTQLPSPTWGVTPSPARCTSCHASRPTTGSHQAHYDAGFSTCNNCHAGAVEAATPPTAHLNGNINVTGYFTPSKGPAFPASSTYTYCASAACHTDGRGVFKNSPSWGTVNNDCSACHLKRPTTGTHDAHMTVGLTCGECHKGAVEGTTAPLLHLNNQIDVYKTTPGDMGTTPTTMVAAIPIGDNMQRSCTASVCHSTGSPLWSTGTTTNSQCTKCHGKGVVLANYSTNTHQQSAPGYGATATSFGRSLGAVSSNVSPDAKVGAHDTHLRSLANIGKPAACTDCHTVPATVFGPGHRDGSSAPSFGNLVNNIETIPASGIPYTFGQGTKVAAYSAGACSNTYCHGVTLPGGTNKNPVWNDGTYLSSNNDRVNDCSKCHGYPPTTSTLYAHSATFDMTCSSCHPHNGYRTSTDVLLGGDTHMNGKLEANKHCDSCHDYDTRGGGTVWGKNTIATEGYGAHAAHINYLKKRMKITTMDSNLDVFGTANFKGICGVCHTRLESNHVQSDRTGATAASKRNITFGDISAVKRQFGASLPLYNGLTGVGSATTLKTCSNVDCHYKTSPIWQSY